MHRRWKKRLTGAISIFLTIIFVSNYALIGLLVDSGRLRMARAVAEGALDNAGASVLSYYNRMLYDLYGLFATDSLTEEDITRLLGDYAEKTLGTVPVEESALTSLVDAVTSAVGGLTGEDGEELPTFDLYSFDAEVTLVDGKRIEFQVSAYDEKGLIGQGTHERFIITDERFLAKAERKKEG